MHKNGIFLNVSALLTEAEPAKSKLGSSHDWFLTLPENIVHCSMFNGREIERERDRERERERERDPCGSQPDVYVTLY